MSQTSKPEPSKFTPKEVPGKVRNFPPASSLAAGKLPPQSLDMEEAVLGALLLEKDAFG